MIPNSRVFDQQTLTLMQEHDPIVQRDRDGVPLCANGQTCDHPQFLKEKSCVKGLNWELGGGKCV